MGLLVPVIWVTSINGTDINSLVNNVAIKRKRIYEGKSCDENALHVSFLEQNVGENESSRLKAPTKANTICHVF